MIDDRMQFLPKERFASLTRHLVVDVNPGNSVTRLNPVSKQGIISSGTNKGVIDCRMSTKRRTRTVVETTIRFCTKDILAREHYLQLALALYLPHLVVIIPTVGREGKIGRSADDDDDDEPSFSTCSSLCLSSSCNKKSV